MHLESVSVNSKCEARRPQNALVNTKRLKDHSKYLWWMAEEFFSW